MLHNLISQPCSNTSTTAGDGEDNDCDGWIDEETDNGIGMCFFTLLTILPFYKPCDNLNIIQ